MLRTRLPLAAMCLALIASQPAEAAHRHHHNGHHRAGKAAAAVPVWVATWATAQQVPEPGNALSPDELSDATLRQIVHTSLGGVAYRIRLSNAFGTQPLILKSVHAALAPSPSSPAIAAAGDQVLTFAGRPDVTIPAGADYLSDPVPSRLPAMSDLAISLYMENPPAQETSHPGARATAYLVHGDHTADATFDSPETFDHWFNLAAVEVEAAAGSATVIALGDSITDGHGATTNGNDRWTDELARRLAPHDLAVANYGIGGNHLLTDGLGPSVLARFDRDVLAPAGAKTVIVFEGVNDLGGAARDHDIDPDAHRTLVASLIAAYGQIIERAHDRGLRVIGATITPFVGSDYYHPNADVEADRQAVNAWIRAPGHFDAVIDFDAVVRDPAAPDRLLAAFDCGDHLHPSPAGYKAMGDAIDVRLLQ